MAVRTVEFHASLEEVSPSAAQKAGVAGEHNATNVTISLSSELISVLILEGVVYRFEFVDLYNGYDTTENFVFAAGSDSVNIDLPNGWTSSGGLATLRLVIAKLGSDNKEEMVLYSLPCRLSFEGRREGSGSIAKSTEKGLSGLIADAKNITSVANVAADGAIIAASIAHSAASQANDAATAANEKAGAANMAAGYAQAVADTLSAINGVVKGDGAGNFTSATKSDIGLENVDNTADMDKPVSTATEAAIHAHTRFSYADKTYQYKFAVDDNGLKFIYNEVV